MHNTKLNEIDYTSLEKMNGAIGAVIREKFKVRESIFFIAITVFSLLIVIFLRDQSINILFVIIVGVASYLGYHAQKIKNRAWKDFATANNWQVSVTSANDAHYIPPGLFGVGNTPMLGDIINANFEGHACDVYSYQFTVGSGKNRKTYYYTIARVRLEKPFPHLVLDSKRTWSLLNRDLTTDSIKLEGDFNKHFNLYFKQDGQINALSIITPDVMQTLIDSNNKQDIEIVGQNLFFIINSDHRNQNQVPVLFQSVDKLADDIKHKSKTLNYVPEQTEEQRIAEQITVRAEKSKQRIVAFVVMAMIIISIPFVFFVLIMVSVATSG